MKVGLDFLLLIICFPFWTNSQSSLTKNELLGGFLPERIHWDLLHYDYTIEVNPKTKTITGFNQISFKLLSPLTRMQVDLHDNFTVDSIKWNNLNLKYERFHWSLFIQIPQLPIDSREQIVVYYHGKPPIAKNAPWDGGYVTKLDKNGKYLAGMAVQGEGSNMWLPTKDGQSDEPDEGVRANIIVPNDLVAVSNGRLIKKEESGHDKTKWTWEIVNPINSYCITFNIGDYVEIKDKYKELDLTYFVLRDHKERAEKQFTAVPEMISIFEKHFGPYPFPEDGYKLVETSFAGMEHQSNIAYGNNFKNGYGGYGNEVARRFDFILIHESAHEWFGNSITSRDISDMWIHEAFTTFAEFVYVEEKWGYDDMLNYVTQVVGGITLEAPIIGRPACNHKGDTDMYYKGAMMLQTLRHHLQNDSLFFASIKGFATQFKKQIIETEDVIQYFSEQLNQDLRPFFLTYLTQTHLPELVITKGKEVYFQKVQPGFQMNIPLSIGRKKKYFTISDTPQVIKGVFFPNFNSEKQVLDNSKWPSVLKYLITNQYLLQK